MTLREAYARTLQAIERGIAEHGAPNTFTLAELEAHYGGADRMIAGRAIRVYASEARGWMEQHNAWIHGFNTGNGQ